MPRLLKETGHLFYMDATRKEKGPGGYGRGLGVKTLPGQLGLGAQAAGANKHLLLPSSDSDGLLVDVGRPSPVGPSLGMAHVMPELRALATDRALGHGSPFT